jgi:putative ABC transport system ATP-binding protein
VAHKQKSSRDRPILNPHSSKPRVSAHFSREAAMGIELTGIQKKYVMGGETLNVLRGVDLHLQDGEFVALMGPSGSGKSTLMNIIGLLDWPSKGQYRLEGQDASSLSTVQRARLRNRHIGYVYQNFNLIPRMSVLENVMTPLMYRGMVARERRERALNVLERVGMTERTRHMPSQLSGGQQQRVAVARALVGGAGVLLADEPTGNLDTRTGLQIMAMFEQLHADGKTVLLVTHDLEIARHAARTIIIRDGRIRADTTVPMQRRALEELANLPLEDLDEPIDGELVS